MKGAAFALGDEEAPLPEEDVFEAEPERLVAPEPAERIPIRILWNARTTT